MFNHVVVPLDGSAFSEVALGSARILARAYHGQILVVRAEPWTSLPQGLPTANVDAAASSNFERLDEADAYLHRIVSQLRSEGFDADLTLFVSTPGSGIARAAALDHADVIVMASHLRWTLPEHAAPSTTLSVLARSHVPILVCRAGGSATIELASADAPIIVPLDGSRLAETALQYAEALARDFGSYLVLLRVLDPQARATADIEREAREYLQSVREEIAQSGGHAVTELRYGTPISGIEAVWRQVNGGMIVMASHGQSGTSDAFFGSVTASMIEEVEAPMLIVQPRGAIPAGMADRSEDFAI